MLTLKEAIGAVLPIIGETGLPALLANLHAEIPSAIALIIAELRARADQTLEGRAPPTLPAPPVLEVVTEEPEPPTIQVFALEKLTWLDDKGRRQGCGPFSYNALPPKAAKVALERRLALEPDNPRVKEIRDRQSGSLARYVSIRTDTGPRRQRP